MPVSAKPDVRFTQAFINNEFVPAASGRTFANINPSTGETICEVSACSAEDVNAAVKAARACFEGPTWGLATTGSQRADYLTKIADIIESEKDQLATLETTDMGKPLGDSQMDMDLAAGVFRYYATLAVGLDTKQGSNLPLADTNFDATLYKEPVGVVGCITPWNYPLLMAVQKVAAALAAGCTVILKPSELAPLTCLYLGDIARRAGLPAGALNVLPGLGPEAGQPLADHVDVDKLSFTGSIATGKKVMHAAAERVAGVSLELGGKSPMIVCPDADLDATLDWVLFGIFQNSGQVCSATSRLLVHKDVYESLVPRIIQKAKELKVGNPLGPDGESVKVGPIVSEGQMKKVLGYMKKGKSEGATLAVGGGRPADAPDGGFYVEPTVFTDVTPEMTIWKEEIFGPVLSVTSFTDLNEAVRLANDTTYGLAASIMSGDLATARKVAKKLRAGVVWENCCQPAFMEAPWGGMRQSGVGRELGEMGLDEYLEAKQITGVKALNYTWGWAP
eukprot:comp22910_c0_seq1/m.36246 comp22910_c0_seq1/g.36246  ORF comp22910_c0_seq1/g.36246 comp22910_c0_seq1/m.36246 type:complete len:506 (-) comp22910_c0_seq1:565-2082(-)